MSLSEAPKEGPKSILSFEETQAVAVPPPSHELGKDNWNALETESLQLIWDMHRILNPDSAEELQQTIDHYADKIQRMEKMKAKTARRIFRTRAESTEARSPQDKWHGKSCHRKLKMESSQQR